MDSGGVVELGGSSTFLGENLKLSSRMKKVPVAHWARLQPRAGWRPRRPEMPPAQRLSDWGKRREADALSVGVMVFAATRAPGCVPLGFQGLHCCASQLGFRDCLVSSPAPLTLLLFFYFQMLSRAKPALGADLPQGDRRKKKGGKIPKLEELLSQRDFTGAITLLEVMLACRWGVLRCQSFAVLLGRGSCVAPPPSWNAC